MYPLVSIIITTKNEELNLGSCLESIKLQKYPESKIEIIVVDNNSSDSTKNIAKKYTKNIYNYGPERSAQRNFGINKAKGDLVLYLDADMILSHTVVAESVEKLRKDEVVGLYIPEIVLGNSYWSKVRRLERSFYDGTSIDCVRIVKTNIFKKVGGFDERLTGPEDWDFDKKVRQVGKVELLTKYDFNEMFERVKNVDLNSKDFVSTLSKLSEKGVVYHNEAKFNSKKYILKKNYYAKSFTRYINKWGKNDLDIKNQFGFIYRYLLIFIQNSQWKKIIKYPHLMFGIFLLRISVGFVFIFKR